jgi:hypothetical protein
MDSGAGGGRGLGSHGVIGNTEAVLSYATRCIQPSMSKEIETQPGVVRSYRAPWKGELLLVCRKCQKKLKHDKNGIAKLKKALKKRARHDENPPRLHVLEVPCLKMCPEGGITVCTQRQLGLRECSIVRSRADVDALYQQYQGSTLDHVQGEAGE